MVGAEIEEYSERFPRLGLALTQCIVHRSIELQERLAGMALCKGQVRVLLALVRFAGESGTAMPDGSTRMFRITHRMIAEYVGTAREMVTVYMSRLRKAGIVRYSRGQLDLDLPAIYADLRLSGAPRSAAMNLAMSGETAIQ